MLRKWKRQLYRAPSHGPQRWIFAILAVIFLTQGILFWTSTPLLRGANVLVGLSWVALAVAESRSREHRATAGALRIGGTVCALMGGLMLIVGGVVWALQSGA